MHCRQLYIKLSSYVCPKPKHKTIQQKMAFFFAFICLFLVAFVSSLFVKKIKHSQWKLPSSPPKLPIIGNLHQLGGGELPHRSLHELSKKYGAVMLLHFGFSPVVIISSSEAAEEVLKTNDLECCSRPKLLAARQLTRNFRDIAFTEYGPDWKERRKLAVREVFSMKKVQSFGYIREEECNVLVKKLSESAEKQSPVDLSKALFSVTASIILKIAFGVNFEESKFIDKDRIEQLVLEVETVTTRLTFSDLFPSSVGLVIDWLSGQLKRLEKVKVEMDTFFQKVIEDHLKPGRTTHDHQDIIHVMLNTIQKQGNDDSLSWLSTDHIKAILGNIFIAGIDTSAITMIWAMTELARNPKLMKKVQDEIRGCLGKKERITEEDLDKVHYLKLVMKETFRLHPPVPLLLPRETMAHIKIQGYDVPPKTQLQINAWAIGRDPKLWENPDEFNPERFMDSSIDFRGQHFELLQFGSGRRICPGMSMGIPTVELGLLNLLYFFDWEFPEGTTEKDIDAEEAGSLTVLKKVPLKLVPVLHH
ncbi:PREDICTED: cytochrome P450 71B19-like [Tarenaya hassleriana]|uniref:cytochrome P450 71B19-like n=1 Tax=Tarenaya hassleriana TaxID=28532 RepID=UPI00053C2193|nr:PREDICTED: cytochrome P450 71B19-like [Tarenaya hassleriana]